MMLIEAELKAVVRDVSAVRAALDQRAYAEQSTYTDWYYDYPDRRLTAQGRELRVRMATDNAGHSRVFLTYKEPAVDSASGSKPEHETTADNADALKTVLTALGVEEFITFQKRCVNYRFTANDRDMLATLVTVPELDGRTFIEVETMARPDEVTAALDGVRTVLGEVGVNMEDLTTEAYTEAVAAHRAN